MAASDSVFQFSLVQEMDGKTYTNQLHYKQAPSDPDPVTLATWGSEMGSQMKANWVAQIQPITADALKLKSIVITRYEYFDLLPGIPPAPAGTRQKLLPVAVEQQEYTDGLPLFGTVEDEYLPGFNAFRAAKKTGLPGRRKRGHISLAGVPELASQGNVLVTGDFTIWSANAILFLQNVQTLVGDFATYVLNPCVFSITQARADHGVLARCAPYGYTITTVVANRLVGTMRRRKKKTV